MPTMTVGRSVGEAMEWLEKAAQEHGVYLEDEFAFSITLQNLERRYGVKLSHAAVLLLAAPILERIELRQRSNTDELTLPKPDVVEDTLNKIVHDASHEPTGLDNVVNQSISGTPNEPGIIRLSLSVIRQFWKHFCDIPPFCGDTGKT